MNRLILQKQVGRFDVIECDSVIKKLLPLVKPPSSGPIKALKCGFWLIWIVSFIFLSYSIIYVACDPNNGPGKCPLSFDPHIHIKTFTENSNLVFRHSKSYYFQKLHPNLVSVVESSEEKTTEFRKFLFAHIKTLASYSKIQLENYGIWKSVEEIIEFTSLQFEKLSPHISNLIENIKKIVNDAYPILIATYETSRDRLKKVNDHAMKNWHSSAVKFINVDLPVIINTIELVIEYIKKAILPAIQDFVIKIAKLTRKNVNLATQVVADALNVGKKTISNYLDLSETYQALRPKLIEVLNSPVFTVLLELYGKMEKVVFDILKESIRTVSDFWEILENPINFSMLRKNAMIGLAAIHDVFYHAYLKIKELTL